MIETDINNKSILVKEGYKETKLGWIPEDWNVCTFADIADKEVKWSITGGPFGSNLKAEHYREEGVRIIQLQNIGDGDFRNDYKIYTSKDKADELLACNIYPGEIILSKMGDPVARACKIPNSEKRWVMGSDGIRLVVDESQYDKGFVLDYINYSIFRNLAISRSTGSTRRRIGLVDLKKIPFIKLPLNEQQKIANILNTWDKAIAAQEKLIVEKQELKNGLMQQLLTGKKRFAGFTREWEEVKLEDVCNVKGKYGIGAAAVTFSNDLPRYLRITDIDDDGNYSPEKEVSILDNDWKEYVLEEGDIVFARTGNTTGKTYLYQEKDGVLVYAGFLIKFAPNSDILNSNYLKFFTQTNIYWNWVKTMSVRSGQPGINSNEYGKLKLLLPSIEEQEKIVSLLNSKDNEIKVYQTYVKKLKKQKQGLMQQLLTGEKRVKV